MKRFCPLLIVFILSAAVYALTGFTLPESMDPFTSEEDEETVVVLPAVHHAEDVTELDDTDSVPEGPLGEDENGPGKDAPEDGSGEQDSTGAEGETGGETGEEGPELPEGSGQEEPAEEEPAEEEPRQLVIGPADPEYFRDALFIGDSRTVGLSEYCAELDERATFYAKTSLTVRQALDKPFVETNEGKKTVYEMLAQDRQYGKIYIMLGINELGGGSSESFREDYREMIGRIRVLQPDAIIVIQGIMHVTRAKSDREKYVNNSRVNARNEALKELENPRMRIFYIDPNEAVDDGEGNLAAELSFDEVHLKAASYGLWYDYLLNHAVVWED